MFNFDAFNRPNPFEIYLCRPDGSIVCELNAIEEDTAEMTYTLNNQFELTFDYDRFISTLDGEEIESNGYHQLAIDMKLLIDDVGYFVIQYPPYQYNGEKEKKTVTAYSVECELEAKDLVGFKINTGESDSLEYLVTYDDDEEETLLNAYTGLPYDYILFDNTYPEQLSELLGKYEDGSTITDEDAIAEIKSYCDMISRLKSKVVTYTGIDENDLEAEMTNLIEYVEYTYDDDYENVISIYLFPEEINEQYPELTNVGFNQRIADLIEYYTKYHDQLSLVSLAIENCSCNWSVGEIDSSLAGKKYQFDVDGENIYSFLTNEVAQTVNCVFSFDLFNKKINAILVENIGEDSGVIIDRNNLMNTVDVSCEEDHIYTRFSVSGADGLGIEYVNFGLSRIDDLRYFLEARDENGKRIYVSDGLAEKYYQFAYDRELARQVYMDYTKTYNQLLADIDEIKYRVPNDVVQTDWDTFTLVELEESLKNYKNLLVTLVSLYKEDYGSAGVLDDESVDENYIRGTMYWYDYYAYKQAITQIQAAYDAKVNDSTYADIDNETVLAEINAWQTEWSLYGTVELQNKIEAYNNQLSVLADGGAVVFKYPPLIDYNANCDSAIDTDYKEIEIVGTGEMPDSMEDKVILVYFSHWHQRQYGVYFNITYRDTETGITTTYYTQPESYMEDQMYIWSSGDAMYFKFTSDNHLELLTQTWEAYTWEELQDDEKLYNMYMPKYSYFDANYYYDTYYEIYKERQECLDYLNTLLPELEAKQAELDEVQASRSKFYTLVTVEGYNREELGKIVDLPDSDVSGTFTENEIKTINLLYIDTTYENDNILTTSLDTTVTAVSVEYDLLLDAREELSISSQPQVTFSTDIDNLLALPEFKDFKFDIGNYTTLKYYDDYYVTLRLYSMTFNPVAPESSLQVSFTNYIRSQSERSDLSYILGQASGVGGGGYGGGGSGSGGAFGTSSDIDVTISNTMLAQLLNSETFGTRVSNIILDTIDVNSLFASVATFTSLGNGTTRINGNCISTGYIVSENYDGQTSYVEGSNNTIVSERQMDGFTTGSIIDLNTGEFNFGGGKLTLIDGNLTVEGTITAAAGSKIGPWVISSTSIYKVDEDWQGNTVTKDDNGNIVDYAGYFGNDGLSLTDQFSVSKEGHLYAQNVEIVGDITATSGTIGGWDITSTRIRSSKDVSINGSVAGLLLINESDKPFISAQSGSGTTFEVDRNGNVSINKGSITIGDGAFSVTSGGALTATNATITGTIYASKGTIGGFTVSTNKLYAGLDDDYSKTIAIQKPRESGMTWVFAAGGESHDSYGDCPFRVHKNGTLYAISAHLSDSIYMDYQGDFTETTISTKLFSMDQRGLIQCNPNIEFDSVVQFDSSCYFNGSVGFSDSVTADVYTANTRFRMDASSEYYTSVTGNAPDIAFTNVSSNGYVTLRRSGSSSIRYKNSIRAFSSKDIIPLYNISVVWFKYNDDYLCKEDERYRKEIPGFISEEWDEIMPIAIDHDGDGFAEKWNFKIVVPLMFEMIKNDHNQIEELKNKISELQASA